MKKPQHCECRRPRVPDFLTVLYEVKEEIEVEGKYGIKGVDEEKAQVLIVTELRCIRKMLETMMRPQDKDED